MTCPRAGSRCETSVVRYLASLNFLTSSSVAEEGIHLTAQMYSSRQMGLTILNRLGVREEKPPVDNKPPVDTPAEPPAVPVLDLDGKTEDGSIPYNILLKQLECMR